VPDKNIKLFNGNSLICRTIKEAKGSNYIDRIVVTTDSEEYAKHAIKCGAQVPFLRSKTLATDTSSASEVILNVINFLKKGGEVYEIFIYLQPTSPFRKTSHIDSAIEQFINNKDADSLISVKVVTENPHWIKLKNRFGFLANFLNNDPHLNRQSLPKFYIPNGAIYISLCNFYIEKQDFMSGNCVPYLMDQIDSIDIDSSFDWDLASYLDSKKNK